MTSHRDVMVALAHQHHWTLGVELGLGKGNLFRRFLSECPWLSMIGVDMFKRPERKALVDAIVANHPGRTTVYPCLTVEAAQYVQARSVDFVFIDAGHSQRAVTGDILAWLPKVKPGGWFGGHDHCDKFPGVKAAVYAAFGTKIDLLPHDVWVAQL